MSEKFRFLYEGEFRKHLFLKGEIKTLKWYSMLKDEYLNLGSINKIYKETTSMYLVILPDNKCRMEVA